MPLSPLCNVCKQIPFTALRGPHPHELQNVRENKQPGQGVVLAEADKAKDGRPTQLSKIVLGSLKQISSRTGACDLCSIILDIVAKQGAVYDNNQSLWEDSIIFRADPDLSYYEYVIDSRPGNTQNSPFVIRRLCVTAHPDEDIDTTLAYFDHCLQPCQLQYEQKSIEEDLGQDSTKTAFVGKLFSGRLRPLVISSHLLRSWLSECHSRHDTRCSSHIRSSAPSYIRLVDIKNKAVVLLQHVDLSSLQYCTLSYVWGRSQPHILLRENIHQFQSSGALATLTLPQTIRDAFSLTEILGFRYIWIDALCIVQDDVEDQQVQISRMADIYGLGTLNIIAAAGQDCHAGLPGLRPGTRFMEQRELVLELPDQERPGLSLLTTLKSYPTDFGEFYTRGSDDFTRSVWNQRGWTLQERALSRRNLIFTDEQVMWSCNSAHYCEETRYEDWEDLPGPESTRLHMRHFLENAHDLATFSSVYEDHQTEYLSAKGTKWYRFVLLVERFTARNFTYGGDVYDGCSAILDTMCARTGENFLWGIPRSRLELGLSWDTNHGLRRRTAKSKLPMTSLNRRVVFPSWSWMGWEGQAHFSVDDDRLELDTPQVIAFTHKNTPLRIVPIREEGVSISETQSGRFAVDCGRNVTLDDIVDGIPELSEEKLNLFPEDYLLFFWTSSVRLTVHAPTLRRGKLLSRREYAGQRRPRVTDTDGHEVGNVCNMFDEHWTNTVSAGLQEFVMVGRRHIAELPEFPATVLALQIERVDGIAYRVNYAEIEEVAWTAAGPKEVLIALG